ncbi:PDZ domain-containing protein, partial [Pseudoduganella danionis]
MNIDKTAAGKTVAIIGSIWALMLVSDLMHPSSQQAAGASEGIADIVRNMFNLNGDTSSISTAGDIGGDGLTLTEKDGVVLVTSIKAGSLADRSGFKVGDRIKAINRNVLHNTGKIPRYYTGEGSTFNVE